MELCKLLEWIVRFKPSSNFSKILPFSSPVADDQETMSEVAYPSSHSRFRPARSSSKAMMPLRRLDTLEEAPSVDILNESTVEERGRTGRGMPRTKSSSSDSRVPASHLHLRSVTDRDNGSADNLRNGHHEAEKEEEEEEQQQPSSPPPAWAAEPRDNTTQNPLLRRPQWNPKKM